MAGKRKKSRKCRVRGRKGVIVRAKVKGKLKAFKCKVSKGALKCKVHKKK